MTDDKGRRPKCIVADDDPEIRSLFYSVLGNCHLELRGFGSAQEVIEACRRDPPDFIFLDVALQGSDAIDVIRALAAQDFRGGIQLVSGRDPTLLRQIKQVGEQHGLTMLPPLHKPFHMEDAEAIVLRYLAQTARGERPAASVHPHEDLQPWLTLDEVLRNGWLEFYYQPKMDLRKKYIVGAELLARCRHPEHGVLAPGSFVPEADETGTLELSTRAIATALGSWDRLNAYGFPLKLAINVTVSDLVKLPVPAIVREHHPRDDSWPGLILEVTEDQAVRDIALTQEIATQLKIYDISLALDDFGAGYSHLARLKQLPFAELKLDRNLVANCGDDASNASLCQTAIDLAHQFGAAAVGEGIERRADLRALAKMGCDIGQGFLLAHPMPQKRFISFLADLSHAARASA